MQITVGVVLLPDSDTAKLVRSLAGKTRGNRIHINSPSYAHLSLLHLVVNSQDVVAIKSQLATLELPRRLTFSCYETLRQENGWSFLEVRKSRALLRMQRRVLPLAEMRVADTSFTWMDYASASQKRAYAKYGYPNVGVAWAAHFTFAVTKRHDPMCRIPVSQKGSVSGLALVKIGKFGTASSILYSRSL